MDGIRTPQHRKDSNRFERDLRTGSGCVCFERQKKHILVFSWCPWKTAQKKGGHPPKKYRPILRILLVCRASECSECHPSDGWVFALDILGRFPQLAEAPNSAGKPCGCLLASPWFHRAIGIPYISCLFLDSLRCRYG